MTREQAIDAYQRVCRWEESAGTRLREAILVRYFGGNDCCRHNWMINYESPSYYRQYGTRGISEEAYKAGKYYLWKRQQIWDTARRLKAAFARYF